MVSGECGRSAASRIANSGRPHFHPVLHDGERLPHRHFAQAARHFPTPRRRSPVSPAFIHLLNPYQLV